MKQRVPVSQIMAKVLIAVPNTKKVSEVNQLFADYNIRHIPVVETDQLIGIISINDILKIGYSNSEIDKEALNDIYDAYKLEDIMTTKPVSVSEDTSIKEVAEMFSKQRFHSLPVHDKEGKLTGIVTTTDLINYLIAQY
ncbi:MAG: CBS domain-containing protein [Flavobacteriaceae bacterium]|jgi:CBS domain-containing protein|nr:CBS domain-containing protein [Flavobacteriaceae bacterium]